MALEAEADSRRSSSLRSGRRRSGASSPRPLTLLLQKHGATWAQEQPDGSTKQFWDLRWAIREGGELICQAEQQGNERLSLVVAQSGGFAEEVGSYTWLWAEFGSDGHFSKDPYWVDGTWKDALISLLLPYQYQSNFYLAAPTETPAALMLGSGEGARGTAQRGRPASGSGLAAS